MSTRILMANRDGTRCQHGRPTALLRDTAAKLTRVDFLNRYFVDQPTHLSDARLIMSKVYMRAIIFAALMLCSSSMTGRTAEITFGIASVDDGKPTRYDGGNGSFNGKLATGAKFVDGLTIAHRTLPLGSCVDLSKIGRDAQIYNAKVDDRGPCDTQHCRRNSPWLLRRHIDLKPKLAKLMGCGGLCSVAYWPARCQ